VGGETKKDHCCSKQANGTDKKKTKTSPGDQVLLKGQHRVNENLNLFKGVAGKDKGQLAKHEKKFP